MAQVERKKEEQKSRRRKGVTAGTQGRASYANLDATQLIYLVMAVAQRGGAVRFGYTRDGGAFAIGIYGDGEPYTEYVRPNDDVERVLREISEAWGNVKGDGAYIGDDAR